MTLIDEGISVQATTSSTFMMWTHFIFFAETESLFVLMISRRIGYLLPKRAFPSADPINEFRAFAQAHVGNAPTGFPVQPPSAA
jgi:hypothetical protein